MGNQKVQKQNILKTLWENALDLVFPLICPVCGAFGAAPCPYCKAKIKNYRSECASCQKISENFETHKACREFFPLNKVIIATEYNKVTKELIAELKYRYVTNLVDFIALKMAGSLGKQLKRTKSKPILIPVPLHKKRKRERGFNQADLLCKVISERLQIPTVSAIKRIKYTKAQATLNREKRLGNLAGAFRLDTRHRIAPNSLMIIVDDVVTTGATLSLCARTLKHNFKFAQIWGLAFARRPRVI